MKILHTHQPKRIRQSGFTMVELLITMSLMGIFMVIITDIVSATMDIQLESTATSATSEDSRFVLARLDYDIGRATAITTPSSLGGSNASLVLTIGGIAHTYALSGGNLQLTNSSGTSNLNSNETVISGVSFQRLGNVGGKETVRVVFTVTSTALTDQGADTRSFTTTLGRRQ